MMLNIKYTPDMLLDFRKMPYLKKSGTDEMVYQWLYVSRFRMIEKGTRKESVLNQETCLYAAKAVNDALHRLFDHRTYYPNIYSLTHGWEDPLMPEKKVGFSYSPNDYDGVSISWVMPDGSKEITWFGRKDIKRFVKFRRNLIRPKSYGGLVKYEDRLAEMIIFEPYILMHSKSRFSQAFVSYFEPTNNPIK